MSDDKKDKLSSDDLNKQIIGAIAKPYKGEQTSRWIRTNLDDNSLVQAITNATPDESLNMPSPVLLDKLFDEFQRYAYEFQNTAAGQGVSVNVNRPRGTDAPTTAQYGKVPVLCQGYISTLNWAMIFFGFVGKVQAFIVPVQYTVGFQPNQTEFRPFVELKAALDKGKTDWKIEGHSISATGLRALSKRFFGALIKVEKGEAKNSDSFVLDPSAIIEEAPMPQRLDASDKVELLSDSVLREEEMRKRQFQQANPQGAAAQSGTSYQSLNQQGQPMAPNQGYGQQQGYGQNQAQQAGDYPGQRGKEAGMHSGQHPGLQSGPHPGLPAGPRQGQQNIDQQSARLQPGQPAQRYQPVQGSQPPGADGSNDSIPLAFDRNTYMIQSAISDFCAKIDVEVDRLTKIGMMSISAQDLAGAQRTIIRSAKLKEMRDRVNDLSNEWNAVVSE